MAIIVTGAVTGQGPTGDPSQPHMTNVVIDWQISGVSLAGQMQGVDFFPVDLSTATADIEASLRASLAAYVATVTGLSLTAADVRGCTL